MIAKHSSLKWEKFGILNWELNFIEPRDPNSKISPSELFEKYVIDVDFNHRDIPDHLLQVLVSIKINNGEKPLTGYRILIEAVGIFDTADVDKLERDQQQNLKLFASTNLMIGRLRGLIPVLSSHAPFGAYNLPLLDLQDLIDQKMAQVKSQREKKDNGS